MSKCSPSRRARAVRLGLIGGMSWKSSADYYERINTLSESRRGAHRNAPTIIDTVEFADLLAAAERGNEHAEDILVAAGERLQAAGCTAVALTAVTAHRYHGALARALSVPVPHIFDAAAAHLDAIGNRTVGLLGTSRALAAPFLVDRVTRGARSAVRPDPGMQREIDALIFDRLTLGIIDDAGRDLLDAAAARLRGNGAEAILLACTELPLLLRHGRAPAPDMVDAVALHINALCEILTDQENG